MHAMIPGDKGKKGPLLNCVVRKKENPVKPPERGRSLPMSDMSHTQQDIPQANPIQQHKLPGPPQQVPIQKEVLLSQQSLSQQQLPHSKQPVEKQVPSQECVQVHQHAQTKALYTVQNGAEVNWNHMILQRFNYLQDNIDPIDLRDRLSKIGFLTSGSVRFKMSDKRCIRATQVMIAVAKNISDENSYIKFTNVLRQSNVCCAVKLDEKLDSVSLHEETTENVMLHAEWLTGAKPAIVEELKTLKKEKLLIIVGNFVEKMIFDICDVEEIVKYIIDGEYRTMASVLAEKIIKYTEKGSYGCLLYASKQTDSKGITQILEPVNELTDTRIMHKVMETLPSILCKNHDLQVIKVKKGSIIIFLKSMKSGMNLDNTNTVEKLFKDGIILKLLKPVLEDKDIHKLYPDIGIKCVRSVLMAKAKETGKEIPPPLSIIEANKSFLIEEIDTGTVLAAFEKHGIDCFEQEGLDLNADRRTRTRKFLDIVESIEKTEMLIEILDTNDDMRYIANRLRKYQRIYKTDVDTSILERTILLNFKELVNILDIDDIEDVFLERRFLNQKIFDDIHDTFGNVSVAAILIEILNSGKDAMLSLIDVLFAKGESDLAESVLHSASTDNLCQEVPIDTEKNLADYISNNGTEFSITIDFADMKYATSSAADLKTPDSGMQEPNFDFIIKEMNVEHKYSNATSSAADLKTPDSGYDSPKSSLLASIEVQEDDSNNSNATSSAADLNSPDSDKNTQQSSCRFTHLEVVLELNKKIQEDDQRGHALKRFDSRTYLYIGVEFINDLKIELKKFEQILLDWLSSAVLVIGTLAFLTNELDDHFSRISKAKIGGSSAAIVGSVLGIIGLALAPVTFGASLGLSIAGGVVAGIGGVTIGGSHIVDTVLSNKTKEKAETVLKKYNSDLAIIKKQCLDLGANLEVIGTLEDDFPEWVDFWKYFVHGHTSDIGTLDWKETVNLINTSIEGIGAASRFVVEGGGAGIRIAGAALRVTGSSMHVASGVIGALMIPFDIYTLVDSAIDVHKKNKHKTSKLIFKISEAIMSEIQKEEDIKIMIECTLDKIHV